ncbi:18665_t:CDS:2, partial [Funneliformis geosporum]
NNPKLSLLEIARLLNELLETSSTLQDKNQKEERKLAGEVGEAISTAIFKHIDRLEGETEPPEAELQKQRIIKQWKRDIENFKKYEPKLEKMFQKYNEQQQKNSAPSEEDETTENSSEEKSSESKEIKQLETKIQLLENQIEG